MKFVLKTLSSAGGVKGVRSLKLRTPETTPFGVNILVSYFFIVNDFALRPVRDIDQEHFDAPCT